MKPYKLKHLPTGLYYQPHKHRGSHLSKKGKIYQTKINGLSDAIKYKRKTFRIACADNSQVYNSTKNILKWEKSSWSYRQQVAETQVSDWVVEELKN
jgi:hypothetical protein